MLTCSNGFFSLITALIVFLHLFTRDESFPTPKHTHHLELWACDEVSLIVASSHLCPTVATDDSSSTASAEVLMFIISEY